MSGVCPHLCPLTRARCSDSIKPIRASGGSERRRWSVASHALATGLERFDNGMTVNLWQMRELDDMRGIAGSGGGNTGWRGILELKRLPDVHGTRQELMDKS